VRDPRMEPGTDEYKAEVKRKIQHGKVAWPKGAYVNPVSTQAKNLIQRLLAKLPDQRLTGEEVLQHEWFRDIDWEALLARKVRPASHSPALSTRWVGCSSRRVTDDDDDDDVWSTPHPLLCPSVPIA
jgi:serine/threonine protein kinase